MFVKSETLITGHSPLSNIVSNISLWSTIFILLTSTLPSGLHNRAIPGHTLPTFVVNGITSTTSGWLAPWTSSYGSGYWLGNTKLRYEWLWIPTNLGNLAPPRLPWPWSWQWATNQNHDKSSSLDPTNCRPPDSSSIPTNHRSPNGPIAIDFDQYNQSPLYHNQHTHPKVNQAMS